MHWTDFWQQATPNHDYAILASIWVLEIVVPSLLTLPQTVNFVVFWLFCHTAAIVNMQCDHLCTRVQQIKVAPWNFWQFSQQRLRISMRNFTHLFSHHSHTYGYWYQLHLIIVQS